MTTHARTWLMGSAGHVLRSGCLDDRPCVSGSHLATGVPVILSHVTSDPNRRMRSPYSWSLFGPIKSKGGLCAKPNLQQAIIAREGSGNECSREYIWERGNYAVGISHELILITLFEGSVAGTRKSTGVLFVQTKRTIRA